MRPAKAEDSAAQPGTGFIEHGSSGGEGILPPTCVSWRLTHQEIARLECPKTRECSLRNTKVQTHVSSHLENTK